MMGTHTDITESKKSALEINRLLAENAHLIESLQLANYELVKSYDATIEGWSRAMDLRDHETEGHTQRVTKMTVGMAQKMGFAESEIIHMRRGALLHDIGKMGIPDGILRKEDLLAPDEFEIIRLHPSYAYEMLENISYLKPALDIPHYHHEKWDGSGYPEGLRGADIPAAARLFAIIDVYDALTTDRPYRKAWTEQAALNYIQSQSGIHFDPNMVEMFFEYIAEPGSSDGEGSF
jgi:putative nucleotidyltransferase with HDIG domain